jgi:hypothetical protein
MKIGIFGDSFANSILYYKGQVDRVGKSWGEVLAEKYDVTNFGLGGSSTYYSYVRFLEHNQKFDKVIFIVSSPGRMTLSPDKALRSHIFGYPRTHQIVGINDTEHGINSLLKLDPDSRDVLTLKSALNYYLYVENVHEQKMINSLYKDMVSIKRPDALVLRAFDQCDKHNMVLCDISAKENKAWFSDIHAIFTTHRELKRCHMTEENNKILASRIEEWLLTDNFSMNLDMFVTPPDWQRYFYKE